MKRALLAVLAVALLAAAVLLLQPSPNAPVRPTAPGIAAAPAAAAARPAPDAAQPELRSAVPTVVAAAPRARPAVRGRLLQDRRSLADVTVYAMSFGTKPQELARTTSAPDGTFSVVVGPDRCWLALQGASVPRGFRVDHVVASPIDRDLGEVHVPLGGVVGGTVRDDAQQPVAGAQVTVVPSEPRPDGPTAELDRAPVVADAAGRFRIERVHPGANRVHARGGDDAGFADVRPAAGETVQVVVALARGQATNGSRAPAPDRSTLRGTVRGHGGAPTTVYIGKADDRGFLGEIGSRLVWSSSDVAAVVDGAFELPDRQPGEYLVVARAEGVGRSKPRNVTLRGDATIELVVEPVPLLRLDVRDEQGGLVNDAEVFVHRAAYVDGDPKLVEFILDRYVRSLPAPMHGARASISAEPDRSLAFAVQAPGFVTMARAFAAGAVPSQLDVVLQRAGNVRGVVQDGDRAAYASTVLLWRVEDDERMRTQRRSTRWAEGFAPHECSVDAKGHFGIDDVVPGRYRAALSRHGLSRTDHRPDQQVGAIALVDEGVDWRGVVEFDVHGGADTHVELLEPKLGTLRGRVLLAGQPFAGALVVATRRGWRPHTLLGVGTTDWDDALQLSQAGGQRTEHDGTFRFLYRDAGDVEIRARHPQGDATSSPTIVTLLPPGFYAECVVTLPVAVLRGRFPFEQVAARDRRLVEAVLFPMHKAAADPYASWDWHPPLTYECARVELRDDGRFAFESLPPGDFVLRVYAHEFYAGRTLWQRVIPVRDVPIDLGDLTEPRLVDARFAWQFDDPQGAAGVELLRAHGDDPAAVWVKTCRDQDGKATLAVEPGRYALRPLQARHAAGSDQVVEVAADGTVTPSLVTFPPPQAPKAQ